MLFFNRKNNNKDIFGYIKIKRNGVGDFLVFRIIKYVVLWLWILGWGGRVKFVEF